MQIHRFVPAAERAIQIFAILLGPVFLVSGVIYLYLGRVTLLWAGDLWDIYAFAWDHTWLETVLLKQDVHVKFFPRSLGLANLRFFKGDPQMLFFAGLGLLLVTVLLLLIAIWRDETVSLTAKSLSTLVVLLGNFWMARATITANGEFNCEDSLAMVGAALAFVVIARARCSWMTMPIVLFAGFLASFSFGTGLAIWPTLLLLAWCLRLPRQTVVLLGISALIAAVIYNVLPVLPSDAPKVSEISLGKPVDVLTQFCRLLGSPVFYAIAAWHAPKPLAGLRQSFGIILSGVAALTLAGVAVIPRMHRRDLGKSAVERIGLSLLIFNLFALSLIAVGRLKSLDLGPFAPRYLFWSSLFWTGLTLLGIKRAEHLRWGRWPALLFPFAVAVFAWPAHYQAWFWCKNAQINSYDKDATAMINGVVDAQMAQAIPPQYKKVFEDRLQKAWQLRARRLDVFAEGLQDWIGHSEADVFGARHKREGIRGECRIDGLGQCDNSAPAARVRGLALKREQSIPSTLVIVDQNGVICGVARSARISPLLNRMFYQGKFMAKIGFVGYIRDYDPELRYAVRSADNLTLSDEEIPVQR
jgi:hypothetical protein